MIHQNAANHLRRDAIEMRTAAPMHIALIHQPEKRLMHQRSALERMLCPLPPQMRTRQTPQFAVYQGHQFFQCALVSVAPVDQKRRNLGAGFVITHPRSLSQGKLF